MQTGYGCVLRDWNGEVIAMQTQHRVGLMATREGEAWGVGEAMRWAEELGVTYLVVETDAQDVCTALQNQSGDESLFGDLVENIRAILRNHSNFKVVWVSRNANVVAHSLARMSRSFESPYCWVEPPDFVDGLPDICTSCM